MVTSPMPSDARTPNKAGEPVLEAALWGRSQGNSEGQWVAGPPAGISWREWGEEGSGGEGRGGQWRRGPS